VVDRSCGAGLQASALDCVPRMLEFAHAVTASMRFGERAVILTHAAPAAGASPPRAILSRSPKPEPLHSQHETRNPKAES
jgi:hypothetical protein